MSKAIIEVVRGVEGYSLYIGDGGSGRRLAGNKPWGGGTTVHSFIVDIDELRQELDSLEKPEDEEPEICSGCNGSGEGMYDGTKCGICKGTGVEPPEGEDDDR